MLMLVDSTIHCIIQLRSFLFDCIIFVHVKADELLQEKRDSGSDTADMTEKYNNTATI